MIKLEDEKMETITGGAFTITGTMLNAVAKAISAIFSIGEAAGSSLRRIKEDSYCPIN